MICPECKSEFVDGILTCSDCKVELVPRLAPEAPHTEHGHATQEVESPGGGSEFVEVMRTIDQGFASFVESVFGGEEIKYYVLGKHSNIPLMAPAPLIFRVREDQAHDALALLNAIEQGE